MTYQRGNTMDWNPTVIGLALDIGGFILVFAFGGFEVGRAGFLLESDTSAKMKPFKIIGAIMVVAGFGFQMIGALSQT